MHTVWHPRASGLPDLKLVEGSLAGRWGLHPYRPLPLFPALGTDAVQTLVQPIARGLELFTGRNFMVTVVTPLTIWGRESGRRSVCPQGPRCPTECLQQPRLPLHPLFHIAHSLGPGFATCIWQMAGHSWKEEGCLGSRGWGGTWGSRRRKWGPLGPLQRNTEAPSRGA